VSNLNTDQKQVFKFIKYGLRCENDEPIRHFVSGVGGTGKSFLIKTIKAFVVNKKKKLYKNVAITAPTGISAYNIHGMTITVTITLLFIDYYSYQ